jgi:hypothetical protein
MTSVRAHCPTHNAEHLQLCFLLCETRGEASAQATRSIHDSFPECPLIVREIVTIPIDPELVREAARELGETA